MIGRVAAVAGHGVDNSESQRLRTQVVANNSIAAFAMRSGTSCISMTGSR